MPRTILYDYHRSSACYRVRIALNLKGLAYEPVTVNLVEGDQKAEDYTRLNPQGLVPMLAVGDLSLTQSLAIIDWLDRKYPDPPFLPDEPGARADILAMALTIACDIHPLNNLRVLKYLSGPLGQPEEARNAWYRHWVELGFAALEERAKARPGPFLGGAQPGLADICLVPQMYNARRFDVDLAPFPSLVRADAEAAGIEAFAAAHPDRVAAAARERGEG